MKIKCKSFVWVVVVFNLILSICGNIVVINSNNNRKFLSTSTTTTSTTTATTSATTANLNRVSSTTESSNLSQKSTTSSSAASNDLPDSNNAVDGKGAPGATTPKIVDLTTPATPPRKRNLNLTKDATATTTSTTTISSTTPSSTTSKTVTNNGNTNSTITNVKIYPTTYRPSRQTSLNSTDRDSQLMNLLAARRNALQRDRTYRPHRRTPTTGRTSEELVSLVDISTSSTSVTNIESTSKAPNDSRSICVRNCTKNFTKRTTASCMRQCAGIKRANATQPSARTKVDEKDNNEILLTDESSHGFFVVTKDLNDTVNHIAPSTEKTRKLRNKSRQPVAAVVDDGPYGYYGQKLQTNRPTVLRINQVSDDLPKILEVSAVPRPQTPVERSRSRSRYNRVSAFSRRQGVANVTRTGTPVSTTLRAITSTATPSTIPTLSTPTTSHTIILLKDEVIPPKYKDVQIGFKPKLRDDSFKPVKSEISLNLNERSVVLDQVQERQPIVQVLPPTTTSTVATTTTTKTTTRATTATTTTTPKPTTTTTTTTRRPTTTTPPSTPLLIAVPEVEVPRETTRYVVITSTRPQPTTTTTTEIPIKQIIEEKEGSESNNGDQPNLIVFLNRTEDDIRTAPTTARSPVDSPDKVASENSSSFFEIFGNSVQIPEDSKVTELNISKEESEVKIETNSMNAAAYVLSGLGMLPIVVIAVYLVRVFVTKKWTKHHNDLDICVTDQQPISPVRKMCKHDDDDDDNDSRDDGYSITSDQEIDRKNLHFKCLLGEGNFGQVWKAEADDLTGHYGTTRIVAVKTVRSGSTQDGLKEEAAIMKKLGSHPNVVTILGACLEAGEI